MKVKTICDHCGKMYQTEAEHIGKIAQCKQCQNNFVLAAVEEAPPVPQPMAPSPEEFTSAGETPSPPDSFGEFPGQPSVSSPTASGFDQTETPPASSDSKSGQINTQTLVCPKCKFTADIPKVSGKMSLRCQECGHKFTVKPEPATKRGDGRGTQAQKGVPKSILIFMVVVMLLAAVVFVGPTLLPDIVPNILP